MHNELFDKSNHFIEDLMIYISYLLIPIWAIKGTIALRNSALFLGASLSLYYIFKIYKKKSINLNNFFRFSPIFLISILFAWVIIHYFYFGMDSISQLKELKSTWARSLAAMLYGVGLGVAYSKNPNKLSYLWFSIILCFIYTFFQYLIKLQYGGGLFQIDWWNGYIFEGKLNAVLIGIIAISGIYGSLIDGKFRSNIFFKLSYLVLSASLILYSYVFIFDSRTGVILFLITNLFAWFIYKRYSYNRINRRALTGLILVLSLLIIFFSIKQIEHNPGSLAIVSDALIAIDIEGNKEWINPVTLGTAKSSSGSTNYFRIAWATAGLVVLMPSNPLGYGLLGSSFNKALAEIYPTFDKDMLSTHSAWVDFGLAFGYPGLSLLLGSVLIIFIRALTRRCMQKDNGATISLISFALLVIYAVGEAGSGHAFEILIFLISFLSALQALAFTGVKR